MQTILSILLCTFNSVHVQPWEFCFAHFDLPVYFCAFYFEQICDLHKVVLIQSCRNGMSTCFLQEQLHIRI
jgi:hypothetical protein